MNPYYYLPHKEKKILSIRQEIKKTNEGRANFAVTQEIFGSKQQYRCVIHTIFFYNEVKKTRLFFGPLKTTYDYKDENKIWHTVLEREFEINRQQRGTIKNVIKYTKGVSQQLIGPKQQAYWKFISDLDAEIKQKQEWCLKTFCGFSP